MTNIMLIPKEYPTNDLTKKRISGLFTESKIAEYTIAEYIDSDLKKKKMWVDLSPHFLTNRVFVKKKITCYLLETLFSNHVK